MIGIYVSNDMYLEIKHTAQQAGKSIKDYLLDLHKGSQNNPTVQSNSDKLDRILELLVDEGYE